MMLASLITIGLACVCFQQAIAERFAEKCLKAHNIYRKLHRVPDLTLSNALTKYAQQWADELANSNTFEHRPNNTYGENLYIKFGSSSVSAEKAVSFWYDEKKLYNFRKPGYSMDTAHFTQIVWKNSKKLGCAIAKKGISTLVVAYYEPAGNYENQYAENVF